jgi:hypothetical protein
MAKVFMYRASLALFDGKGELHEAASRDFKTMDGGELDSWLGELAADGIIPSDWQWGEGCDDIESDCRVIGQCTSDPMTEFEWTGGRSI